MTTRRTFLSVMGGYLGLGVTGSINSPVGRDSELIPATEIPQFDRDGGPDEIDVSFIWSNQGVSAEFTTSVSRERYKKLTSQSTSRRSQFIRNADSNFMDTLQNEIYEAFEAGLERFNENSVLNWSMDRFPRYRVMYSFVQSIYYETDLNTVNRPDYVRHPIEILVDGVGDCTGRTVFLAGLLSAIGHDTGYAILPGHMVPLVSLEDIYDYNYNVWHKTSSTKYTIIESTDDVDIGKGIQGYTPEDFLYVYTVEDGFDMINPNNLPQHLGETTENTVEDLNAPVRADF